eukprot:CAMPEP_0206534352 /NCGR_PEP_ID=MMETSP0325_2-20121206/5499_1 /ASSEMBLY_ACC=CAM_ASM_000347 /TAXON_ID=2866 /ORGANISM="Crypthecodinium cohnii, Strain Seligo" /LENGTH=216 /DNA_ID=CAMNT_0054031149 /DNA_START=237 /DNA_END=888 /DNA_ORIENTATION=+
MTAAPGGGVMGLSTVAVVDVTAVVVVAAGGDLELHSSHRCRRHRCCRQARFWGGTRRSGSGGQRLRNGDGDLACPLLHDGFADSERCSVMRMWMLLLLTLGTSAAGGTVAETRSEAPKVKTSNVSLAAPVAVVVPNSSPSGPSPTPAPAAAGVADLVAAAWWIFLAPLLPTVMAAMVFAAALAAPAADAREPPASAGWPPDPRPRAAANVRTQASS